MLYFILWSLLLLSVVLSIPIVAMVESNRRKRALAAAQEGTSSEQVAEEVEPASLAEEGISEVQVDEGFADAEGGDFGGGGDFSAFDEVAENPQR